MLVALGAAFGIAAVLLLVVGLARLRTVQRRDSELQGLHRDLLRYVAEMRQEVTFLELGAGAASAERLEGLVEECSESVEYLETDFGDLLEGQPAYEEMQEEWTELVSAGRNGWARYATDLAAFEGHLENVREGVEENLALARQTAAAFCGAGVIAASMASFLSVWVLLTVLSDIASESYDPGKLEEEVASLAESDQFKSRIKLLADLECPDDTAGDWELRLARRFPEKRTHVCFEATASRNGKQVSLWGKRYKWAGFVKSHQRICFPAFGEATWRALCIMYNNGLDCPAPIVFKRLRAGPFKAGAIILMEHVGEVQSVRNFLSSEFCLLSEDQQVQFLRQATSFLHSLHNLGIYGVKPRYLHGRNMRAPNAETRLYLFDLDKVLLWKSCPSWIAGMLVGKDHRRLIRKLEPMLSNARLETVKAWLQKGRAEKDEEGE
ncbi:MAG: lipopolysaccharide kinase InaA family protein [Candidatus Brocadiia bacterium]